MEDWLLHEIPDRLGGCGSQSLRPLSVSVELEEL